MAIVEIRIETRAVAEYQGFSGDHIYLVGVDETGQEFVIRGGPIENLPPWGNITVEVNEEIEDSEDARDPNVTVEQNRIDRGSRILDLDGRNPDDVWQVMLQQAARVNDLQILLWIIHRYPIWMRPILTLAG